MRSAIWFKLPTMLCICTVVCCAFLILPANAYLIRVGPGLMFKANPEDGIIEVHRFAHTSDRHYVVQIEPLEEADFISSDQFMILFSPADAPHTVVAVNRRGDGAWLQILDNNPLRPAPNFGFTELFTGMLTHRTPVNSRSSPTALYSDFPAFNIAHALNVPEFLGAVSAALTQNQQTDIAVPSYQPTPGGCFFSRAREGSARRLYRTVLEHNDLVLHYEAYSPIASYSDAHFESRYGTVNDHNLVRISPLRDQDIESLYKNRWKVVQDNQNSTWANLKRFFSGGTAISEEKSGFSSSDNHKFPSRLAALGKLQEAVSEGLALGESSSKAGQFWCSSAPKRGSILSSIESSYMPACPGNDHTHSGAFIRVQLEKLITVCFAR